MSGGDTHGLAALGFLNPRIAAAAMYLSSAFVVWNSLRLRRFGVAATGMEEQRQPGLQAPAAGP